MKNNTLVIGLTGGIASGKSKVLQGFKKLGAKILDCDSIVHRLLRPGTTIESKIIDYFGSSILGKEGNLNRKALGSIVFSNPKKRKIVEAIIHPEVIRQLKTKIEQTRSKLLVIDIPLLYEVGLKYLVHKTVVVWVTPSLQIERLMKRDRLSLEEAKSRIRTQWPLDKKRKCADFVIDNSNDYSKTRSQIKNLHHILTKNY